MVYSAKHDISTQPPTIIHKMISMQHISKHNGKTIHKHSIIKLVNSLDWGNLPYILRDHHSNWSDISQWLSWRNLCSIHPSHRSIGVATCIHLTTTDSLQVKKNGCHMARGLAQHQVDCFWRTPEIVLITESLLVRPVALLDKVTYYRLIWYVNTISSIYASE